MSLLRQRKQIEQAVAGLLPLEDERKLRAHLADCYECRTHYDQLTMQARLLAGSPGPGAGADERELARLTAAIAPKATPVRTRGWLPALAFAGACAALFLVLVGLPKLGAGDDDIVWRGAADAGAEATFELLVYAAPLDGGKLEQRANFPLDATSRIQKDQWVAFAPREASRKFGYFRAVLVPEQGAPLIVESGHSLALDPGRWRVFGVLMIRATEGRLQMAVDETAKDAKRLSMAGGLQSYGEILVEP